MAALVKIVEVSPRDGLQNEKTGVPTDAKLRLITALLASGLTEIEVTSFVSPKWVPQLADAEQVCAELDLKAANFSALVPNLKGLERAVSAGIERIALFTAASDTFCRKNINMGREESILQFGDLMGSALGKGRFVRVYVSTAFECPWEGRIFPHEVADLAGRLFALGVDEVSFGDTIGVAGPSEVHQLLDILCHRFDPSRLALHFHDTHGTAIANVGAGLAHGIRIFDSSAGGLGGCPYSPGSGGNLATEDLIYFLHREGWETGVDLDRLARASLEVLSILGREPRAKEQIAVLNHASADSCAR